MGNLYRNQYRLELTKRKGPIPGSGAITGFLKVATQVEPIIIGKPSSVIMESALDYLNAKFPDRHFTKKTSQWWR